MLPKIFTVLKVTKANAELFAWQFVLKNYQEALQSNDRRLLQKTLEKAKQGSKSSLGANLIAFPLIKELTLKLEALPPKKSLQKKLPSA